ncbi:MAG TPA: DUF5937 family protein [Mycobacteriales bacterium]|nr:DUF5937 family protein [Mycobacteriales bacterium]
MPVTIELSVADLAGTRFAVSQLSETISGLQKLAYGESSSRWVRWARDELSARPLALPRTWPLLVTGRPSWPQFLLPAPAGPGTTIDDDLAAMRRTRARDVRASLRRTYGEELPATAAELAAHPAAGLREIAAELREAYERLVAPHWDRIRAVLEADIAHRARQLTTGGAARLFADLHPDVRWEDGRLVVARDRPIELRPGGLVLLPVVLGPPAVVVKGRSTTRTTLRYPARGAGTLWAAGTRPAPGRTVRLLGRHRAALLAALRSPATTTALARSLGVTPSAVAQHLAILRENDLVTGQRIGRTVLYTTTPAGLALLDP